MAGPGYHMFRAQWKEAWFQLSKEERASIFGKLEEAMKKAGGKSMLTCDSSWNSEHWWFWGVEEYPSIEAVQEHSNLLNELEWLRYVDSETLLGTAVPQNSDCGS